MKQGFLKLKYPIETNEWNFIYLEYHKSTYNKKCQCCKNIIKKNQVWIHLGLLPKGCDSPMGWGDCLCSYECLNKHIADMFSWIKKCEGS